MKKLITALLLVLPVAASAADCGFPKDLLRWGGEVTDCGQYLRSIYINTKDLSDFAKLEKGQSGRVFLADGKQVGAMLAFSQTFLQRPSPVVPGVMESIDAYDYTFMLTNNVKGFDECDFLMSQDRLACVPNEYPALTFTAKGRVERGNELVMKYSPMTATVRQYQGFYIMEGRLDGQLFYGYFWL